VIARAWSLLDERLDAVAATARQVFAVRMVVGFAVALLTSYIYGPALGAGWLAAFIVMELFTRAVTRPIGQGLGMSRRQRLGDRKSVV
jgi:pheromone shutdown protein TraB